MKGCAGASARKRPARGRRRLGLAHRRERPSMTPGSSRVVVRREERSRRGSAARNGNGRRGTKGRRETGPGTTARRVVRPHRRARCPRRSTVRSTQCARGGFGGCSAGGLQTSTRWSRSPRSATTATTSRHRVPARRRRGCASLVCRNWRYGRASRATTWRGRRAGGSCWTPEHQRRRRKSKAPLSVLPTTEMSACIPQRTEYTAARSRGSTHGKARAGSVRQPAEWDLSLPGLTGPPPHSLDALSVCYPRPWGDRPSRPAILQPATAPVTVGATRPSPPRIVPSVPRHPSGSGECVVALRITGSARAKAPQDARAERTKTSSRPSRSESYIKPPI